MLHSTASSRLCFPPAVSRGQFKALNSQLNREVDTYERAVKAGTHTLSGGDFYEPDEAIISSALTDAEVHGRILGGGGTSTLLGSREEMRQKALEAAMRRMRIQEQDIEEQCGSDGPAALQ